VILVVIRYFLLEILAVDLLAEYFQLLLLNHKLLEVLVMLVHLHLILRLHLIYQVDQMLLHIHHLWM
jgi:hypothetical protein